MECALCGGTGYALELTGVLGLADIARCEGCGLLRTVLRRPLPAGNSSTGSHEEEGAEQRRWAHRARHFRRLADLVGPPPPGGGRLVDVGCAGGETLALARERGWTVHGVDTDAGSARAARERLGADAVHEGTLETAPFAAASFDVVLLSHSLEHILDPVSVLGRVRELLRPGGRIIVLTPNCASLFRRLKKERWNGWGILVGHVYHYSDRTLPRMLEKAGFRDLAVTKESTFHGSYSRLKRVALRVLEAFAAVSGTGDQVTVVGRKPI